MLQFERRVTAVRQYELRRDYLKGASMRRFSIILVPALLGCLTLAAQQFPEPTELAGKPFAIKKTWVVGGEGNWDYLTLDPAALQLFVAHGPVVQVVDVGTGTVTGVVSGMKDAHGVALDDAGALGYISDGPSNEVKVFDRRTMAVVAKIHTGPNPRAIVFDPSNKLVFAICTEPSGQPVGNPSIPSAAAARQASRPPANTRRSSSGQAEFDPELRSVVTIIDAETSTRLGDILLPGKLGFAQTDGEGHIFVNITDRNQIARLNAGAVEAELHKPPQSGSRSAEAGKPQSEAARSMRADVTVDWSGRGKLFSLGPGCIDPRGLAVDPNHSRLFVACGNMKMEVLDSDTGDVLATLPIGPGADAIGYDASRGLIFTSNGGGDGSVTVIRQHVTDTYAIIQELPTRQRARTLAVNSATGEVFVVTNLIGFDLNEKGVGGGAHTLPVVRAKDVKGSFQVLVIGN
jgi:YVTN family beta-propeller protein